MSEKIAGKTFSTREELGLPPQDPAEIAEAKRILENFHNQIEAVPPEERTPMSRKFWDDTSGTEFDNDDNQERE